MSTEFQPRRFVRAAVELLEGLAPGDSVLLEGLSWEEYVWFDLQRTEKRPNILLAYHECRLGFAANAFVHENNCQRLRSFVLAVAVAFKINLVGAGRTTFRRTDLRACVQADASYYIPPREALQGVRNIDLCVHPPPDLVIEVEDPRSPLPKLPIHAAIGVPEVWVLDRDGVTIHWLGATGEYEPHPASRALPMVKAADVWRLISDDWPDDTAFGDAAIRWALALAESS